MTNNIIRCPKNRSVFLLFDAYHSVSRLPVVVTQLINGFAYPSLIATMVMFDRLLAALVNWPSSSSSSSSTSSAELPRSRRRPIMSPTTASILVVYIAATAVLYPVATMVPGSRASVLIIEAAFSTWGFALTFVAGGRCLELRRVGRRADEARRKLVAYVRLKRQLAAETEKGRPTTRQQRQQLKLLRREVELSAIYDGDRRPEINSGKNPASANRRKYDDERSDSSSSSSLSLSFDEPDSKNRLPSIVASPELHVPTSSTQNGKLHTAVVKTGRTTTRNCRPTDLPLWTATASVISAGVGATPSGYSPLPRRETSTVNGFGGGENSASADEDVRRLGVDDEMEGDDRTDRPEGSVSHANHDDCAGASGSLSTDVFEALPEEEINSHETSSRRRYERFTMDFSSESDRKQRLSTSQRFFARFRFRSLGNGKGVVDGRRDKWYRRWKWRRSWASSDVDVDNNSDDASCHVAGYSVSGWKSETTLLSRLSMSETMPSLLLPMSSCGLGTQKAQAPLIPEADSSESDDSGKRKFVVSDGISTPYQQKHMRSATGSPGYAADSELESPTMDADAKSITTVNWKWSSAKDVLVQQVAPHPISAVDDEYDTLLNDGCVAIGVNFPDCPPHPQPVKPARRERRPRLADVVVLRRAVVVSGITVVMEFVLCAVQIYAMFGIYGVLSNVRTVASPWSWLAFQSICR
jgi:hypothetical protein